MMIWYSSRFSDKSTSQLVIESLSSCTVWILSPRTPQIGGHQHEPRSCLEAPQIEISNHELYISDDHHLDNTSDTNDPSHVTGEGTGRRRGKTAFICGGGELTSCGCEGIRLEEISGKPRKTSSQK
ncbi:predicted protein [Arabidopsis lyrata subsp. lyrata]|uniref:Predicted protein n=1 Tax=Arabidopsis lyrata subsp. lyrata TaxID=81972 RepID=D7KMZ1_ARALL|nr:predicted protein [Arabidopsis lyrata subsp. lyrata]